MSHFNSVQHYNELSQSILSEYNQITHEFSQFQKESKLTCLPGCGKCCFKPDIYCSPIELLPLALHLLNTGEAENYLEKSLLQKDERCMFLQVSSETEFKASCEQYFFRPLTCRTFGVSARHLKTEKEVEFQVCKTLKENKPNEFQNLVDDNTAGTKQSLPFIGICKNRLISLDPRFLEKEFPINEALKMMLEKILHLSQYQDFTTVP